MTPEQKLHSDLAVPPGEYLEEVISELGMTKDELVRRMGQPATKVSSLFQGTEAGAAVGKTVGVPANIWLELEAEYRLALACESEDGQLDWRLMGVFRFDR